MVQAVNGVGLVSLDDNQGRYYEPDQIPPALSTAQTTLTPTTLQINTPIPTSGAYGSTAAVSAQLTGAGSGQEVVFSIGGSTVDASTDASGHAMAQIPLTNNPGSQYKLNASFGGSSTLAGSSAPATSFTIQKLPTTLVLGGNGSATVAFGGKSQIVATLASGGAGLASYPVAFVFTPSNGTPGSPLIQQTTTGVGGIASLGIGTQLPTGTYVVQAFFGSPGPNLQDDPIFMPIASAGTFALTVGVAPAITSTNAATFTTGTSGSFTVKTSGFPTSAVSNTNFTGCTKSALPSGVTLADNHNGTATLSGKPAAGTNSVYTLCLTASNGVGSSATQVFTLTVTTLLGSGTTACNGVYSGSGSQLTVAAGAVCALLPGSKVSGNVQVNQGGKLNDQGAIISGNLQASNAAWIEIGGGGSVGGNLQVQGTTGSPAGSNNFVCSTHISGNVTVQSSTAAAPFDIGNVGACAGGPGLTIGGNLQVQSNAAPVTVGGNTVNGNLIVSSNAAKVTVIGNTAKGNITVQSNTVGGGTLTGNIASGNCTLQSNNPKIGGSGNSATGTNTCNKSA